MSKQEQTDNTTWMIDGTEWSDDEANDKLDDFLATLPEPPINNGKVRVMRQDDDDDLFFQLARASSK